MSYFRLFFARPLVVTFFITAIFAATVNSAAADQATLIPKEEAEAALVILEVQSEVRHFCAPCGERDFSTEQVLDVTTQGTGYKESNVELWKVLLNGQKIDLAYIYFLKDGSWSNLALHMGIEGVRDVPETIPDVFVDTLKGVNADKIIKHCWDISEEKRSTPNTAVMREGNLDTALCLEQEVINHASYLIRESSMNKEDIVKLINDLRGAYARLYWVMFNGNKGCDPGCGTENYIRHNSELAMLYEKILKDIIFLRLKHGV